MDKLTNSTDLEEELTLRIWDGDESALGDLLIFYAQPIETAIQKRFPTISHMAEDVVAESFRHFWQNRANYDSSRKLGPYLYTIACNIAKNLVSGHSNLEKMRLLERSMDFEPLSKKEADAEDLNEKLNSIKDNKGLTKALNDSLSALPKIERTVIEAYAYSGDFEIKAGHLGIEIGNEYNNGIPIPAGTIRQKKRRARKKVSDFLNKRGFDLRVAGDSK